MAARPAKRRKLTPSLDQQQNGASIQKSFFKSAANWSLEADYAARRKRSKKESNKLPIKTYDGRIQQGDAYLEREEVESDEEWLNGADVAQSSASEDDSPPKPEKSERELVKEAKEELAKIATAINEEPEENAAGFKAMARVGQSDSVAVQTLSLVTQMAVYKDVIPGYRIRPISEEAKEGKVSKEVRRLRNYEQTLVTSYQAYIKELARCSKLDPSTNSTLPSIAITCTCTLVTSVPHFNFRGDLLRILVGKLSKLKVDNDFVKCRTALQTLFRDDEDGAATMEAVSLLGKMMKAREYRVDESVLNLFLHLRLLSEYTGKASQDQADDLNGASKLKLSKKNRQFRTKRQRKQLKEEKALEKDMTLADAQVNHEERERMQSETLKLVFATYFRILKLRLPRLMGAVLEGLAKYAHLINMDFFGDLLEAMRDLIKHAVSDEEALPEIGANEEEDEDITARNTSREALLCAVTAFALLESQDASKARSDPQLDLPFFQNHLYQTLFPLSVNNDLELTSKSSHRQSSVCANDPSTATSREYKVNLQTTTVLLLRSLTAVLLPTFNSRAVPAARLAAFIKQLATISLQLPEKSTRALLGLLSDLVRSHGRKISALWNTEERIGDGKFRPLAPTPESSNPFAATVWEGELLRRHYCPEVREGVKMLEKAVGSAGS